MTCASANSWLLTPHLTLPIRPAARGFSLGGKTSSSSSGIGSAIAGGAASGAVGNLLGEIESLFRRDDDLYVLFNFYRVHVVTFYLQTRRSRILPWW